MNTRLSEILNQLEITRQQVEALITPLTQAEMDKPRGEGKWSVGEHVHHMNLTEILITGLLVRKIAQAQKNGIGPDTQTSSVLGCLDQHEIEAAKMKYESPATVLPRQKVKKEDLLKELASSRSTLVETMEKADKYDLSKISYKHPALGILNLYQWLVFLWKHELRHLNQLKPLLD